MEFDSDWLTLGRHRVRLRSTKGYPTELMHSVAQIVRLVDDPAWLAECRAIAAKVDGAHPFFDGDERLFAAAVAGLIMPPAGA